MKENSMLVHVLESATVMTANEILLTKDNGFSDLLFATSPSSSGSILRSLGRVRLPSLSSKLDATIPAVASYAHRVLAQERDVSFQIGLSENSLVLTALLIAQAW